MKYVLGTKIEKANRLSRRLDWKVEVKKNNKNQILIKKQQICNLTEVVIEGPEIDIIKKIKITREKNEEVFRVVEEIKKIRVKVLRGDKQQMEGELMLKEGKVYILKNEELRVEIIQLHYNMLVAGYGKRQKIMELITRSYWWLEVTKDIEKYCDIC